MPRRLEQRGGRVDRIGQLRRVHVVGLVAKGTCEEDVLARLAMRVLRAEKAMELLPRNPSEERVAAMVLGGEPAAPDSEAPISFPPGVVAACPSDASGEAARITTARMLQNDIAAHAEACALRVVESGTVLTHIRRRRRRRTGPERFWLLTFTCCSPEQQAVWQPVFALYACSGGRTTGSAVETRLALDPSCADLAMPARHHVQGVTDALRKALEGPANLWMEREQAIAGRLRERHARLSATLLQPGLFDRRSDRLASEHHEALQEALSRSSLRIAHLSGLSDVRADAPSFVFGLLVE
jgi:hypothetical protein